MSLYQKYRAQTFKDVLTQKHVTQILQNALKQQSYGHAYLLVGTRGSGKTSIARIFAKALNCNNTEFVKNHGEPCNQCKSCKMALSGNHPDIIEMDAASNRGIDEIRMLKESIEFVPSFGKKKVYIIDEVHMMTKEAFNALLKTLEEPPNHVVFILCTTEIHKVPPTIVSRTQVLELRFASIDEILFKINFILDNEGYEIDEQGKIFIAKLGKGSFRDTESILEKVLSFSQSNKISFTEVTQILGFSNFSLVLEFKDLLYSKDLLKIQSFINNYVDEGNVVNFNYQVSEVIYEDILSDLKKNFLDKYKLAIFEYLCGLEKDLKGVLNQKILYVAKIMNFIASKLDGREVSVQQRVDHDHNFFVGNVEQSVNAGSEQDDKDTSFIAQVDVSVSNINLNPVALLRNSHSILSEPSSSVTSSHQQKPKSPYVSKMDFLDFVKTRNMFLYKLLINKGFDIRDSKIVVKVDKKLEEDLLKSSKVKTLVEEFALTVNQQIFLEVEKLSSDQSPTANQDKNDQKKRTIDALSDEEIKNLFRQKQAS